MDRSPVAAQCGQRTPSTKKLMLVVDVSITFQHHLQFLLTTSPIADKHILGHRIHVTNKQKRTFYIVTLFQLVLIINCRTVGALVNQLIQIGSLPFATEYICNWLNFLIAAVLVKSNNADSTESKSGSSVMIAISESAVND